MSEPASQPATPEKKCSMCAQPSTSAICDTCEAKIRGELLDKKQRDEKD